MMCPHGDRRDGAESRGVEDEEVPAVERHDHIVSVLVLCDDLAHGPRWHLDTAPVEDVGQGSLFAELCGSARYDSFLHFTDASYGDTSHTVHTLRSVRECH